MWIVLVGLAACSDYGFGRDVAPDTVGADDTDTNGTGTGDTDGADTDPNGDGTIGDDTDDITDDTDPTWDTDVPEIPDDACEFAAELDGYLDQFQTPGDGHVYYCHSGSGNYTLVDSNISSCLTHLDHDYDVFPTTLCDS